MFAGVLVLVMHHAAGLALLSRRSGSLRRNVHLRTRSGRQLYSSAEPTQSRFNNYASRFTSLFPVWTLVAAGAGLGAPAGCASLGTPSAFAAGLGLLMVSMGLTLTPTELRSAAKNPRALVVNAIACFVTSPVVALGLAAVLRSV